MHMQRCRVASHSSYANWKGFAMHCLLLLRPGKPAVSLTPPSLGKSRFKRIYLPLSTGTHGTSQPHCGKRMSDYHSSSTPMRNTGP